MAPTVARQADGRLKEARTPAWLQQTLDPRNGPSPKLEPVADLVAVDPAV